VAACNVLIGLDQYRSVPCALDCGAGMPAAEAAGPLDGRAEAEVASASDGGADADADAGEEMGATPEGGFPIPTSHETWAHWPMPNPDAASAPDSSPLPHPMTYDAGADGESAIVLDFVTGLQWRRQAAVATDYGTAWTQCLLAGTRVPTRIELVSLVDFTQPSGGATIDPTVFPAVPALPTWTSSAFAGDDGPSGYWVVDFATGLTANGVGSQVLCVSGGTP
jgi:hypothetical protein